MFSPLTLTLATVSLLGQQSRDGIKPTTYESTEFAHIASLEERTQTFQWFSDLGFPDVKGRKLVRVSTGNWYQAGKDKRRNTFVFGFLLRDKEGGFTVQTLSQAEETYIKTPADSPAHELVTWEAKDLATVAAACLKSFRAKKGDEDNDEGPDGGVSFHVRTETFVLAWACWRNGLDDLSADLFDLAATIPPPYGSNSDQLPSDRLQKLVAEDIADNEMKRTLEEFGEPAVSRKELLERFERILRRFPENEHHEQAKQYGALRRRMIKEDQEHAQNAVKPFDKLSKREQIAELIFQLRDQNGHQYCQPGRCDIFEYTFDSDEKQKKTSPAHRLVEIGNDAIPQLIEVLEDERVTRSLEIRDWRSGGSEILRIGDCAAQILNRITDWDFGQQPVYTGEVAGTRAKAAAWWKEFQDKGEQRMLTEATEKGDFKGLRLAARLVRKYPDSALPALAAGARNADDAWYRAHFVSLAGDLKGYDRVAFLREELSGPFQTSRIAAAEALLRAGNDDGVTAMIREWEEIGRVGGPDASSNSSGLISFLLRSGKPEAMRTLAVEFLKRPVQVRAHIVEELGESKPRSNMDTQDELQSIAECVLFKALDDRDIRLGMSIGGSKGNIDDPRICDLAARSLVDRWERRDLFNLFGSPRNRDRQILGLKNRCLKKQGREPVPLPPASKPSPAPEKRVISLLDEVRAAKTHDERRHALKTLDALGLAVLPAVREALADLPDDHRARADLSTLATRLAFRIHEVRFAQDSPEPSEKLRGRIAAFRGKILSEQDFLDILVGVVQEFPGDAQGVRIAFERPGDDSGASLIVSLLAGQQKGNRWRSHQQVFIDNQATYDSHDSTDMIGFALTKPEKAWATFATSLKSALQSGPSKDISVLVEMVRRE